MDVHAMISNEFHRYQNLSEELRIPGAMPDCDREALQYMIMQEWDMKMKPPQDLLPYLVGFIADFANAEQANHNDARNHWAGMLNSDHHQQQQQFVSKKPRTTSAACGAATASAAAKPDSKQRPAAALKDVVPQIDALGRSLSLADLQKVHSHLQRRAAEDVCNSSSNSRGGKRPLEPISLVSDSSDSEEEFVTVPRIHRGNLQHQPGSTRYVHVVNVKDSRWLDVPVPQGSSGVTVAAIKQSVALQLSVSNDLVHQLRVARLLYTSSTVKHEMLADTVVIKAGGFVRLLLPAASLPKVPSTAPTLYIRFSGGGPTLEVKGLAPWMFIYEVKLIIYCLRGIPAINQVLHGKGGTELQNKGTLQDHQIKDRSTLDLVSPWSMQLFVKMPEGNTITLEVNSTDSIETVRRYLEDRKGGPADQQLLIYAGKLLENGRTLEDYRVLPEATVHLALRLRGC